MPMRMLIDAGHQEETRVAVVKGTRIEEFDFESTQRKELRGNIYLAKVTRVEPSLQAAFVDYGRDRHGFLSFSEIHPDYYRIPTEDRDALLAQEAEANARSAEETDRAADKTGNDEDGDEPVESIGEDEAALDEEIRAKPRFERRYKIQEVISRGQILLVQAVKEERGNKGAALTTYLSLAGRYCVLMPNSPRGGGVSRKIANPKDRKQLKSILGSLEVPPGMGAIIRTAGMSRTKAEIKRDYSSLLRQWDEIRELTLKSTAPTLVHEEGNLIKRSIRDLYTRDIDEVLVEGEAGYKTAKSFMRLLMPSHAKRIKQYEDHMPLFMRYQIESQLDSMYGPIVQLKSGGYIVINTTEALVAIDVNSGRATREANIEQTALKTNLEAAQEVARQLRLRDLAGLIVIDFIDMEEHRNNRSVERKLKECLKSDRARLQVGRISHFGLLEMSRQRLRRGLLESSTTVCTYCEGKGILRTTESAALFVLRAIEEEGIRERSTTLLVHTAPDVATYLLNQKRRLLTQIEEDYHLSITLEPDSTLIADHHFIERIGADTGGVAVRVEEKAEPAIEDKRRGRRRSGRGRGADNERREAADSPAENENNGPGADSAAKAGEDDDSAEKPAKGRRRRGRRGGRRRRGRDNAADQSTAETSGTTDAPGDGEATPAVTEGAQSAPVAPETGTPETGTPETGAPETGAPETGAVDQTADQTPDQAADAAGEKTRKPRRRRRKAASAPATTESDAVSTTETQPEAQPEAEAKVEASAEPEAVPETDEKPTKKPARSRSRRKATTVKDDAAKEPVATEPVKEPAVRETAASQESGGAEKAAPAKPEATPDPDAPKRRGWWQRRSKSA